MSNLALVDSRVEIQQPLSNELYFKFIDYIDAKPKTIETYTRALRQFFIYLYDRDVKRPTRANILEYRDYLKSKVKPTTVQNYITAVRLFFKWTAQEGFYDNIADNIKGATLSKSHKKDYLTSRQVKEVLDNIDRDTEKSLRDYAIIALMVTGGLRTIEVERANIEDIRTIGDSTVLFIQGKGEDEKTEFVKLPYQVEKAIRSYLKERGEAERKEALFTSTSNNNRGKRMTTRSISGIVKEALKGAGFKSDRLTAHSLRHTAGTLNLINGGSLEETQQLLRHSNINTTMIYLHHMERANNNSEERIAGAIF